MHPIIHVFLLSQIDALLTLHNYLLFAIILYCYFSVIVVVEFRETTILKQLKPNYIFTWNLRLRYTGNCLREILQIFQRNYAVHYRKTSFVSVNLVFKNK